MAIINQFDKRSGITYVYESISYWDKEKKQPRAKRTLSVSVILIQEKSFRPMVVAENTRRIRKLLTQGNQDRYLSK